MDILHQTILHKMIILDYNSTAAVQLATILDNLLIGHNMNNNFIQITYLSVLKRIDLKLIARLTQLKNES